MALSPLVMGIVNTTPDSFFPESRVMACDEAIARGRDFFLAGADIVDVGGESTRPGADDVDEVEELARVRDVVAGLAPFGPVSIDTKKASVARACVDAGAQIINDVSGTLYEVAGELRVGYVAMHRQGESKTMQDSPQYGDVVEEVYASLMDLGLKARTAGVEQLWLDPGIGFGKTTEHNVALLASIATLVERARSIDAGVLVGTSRKRFLEDLSPLSAEVDDRLEGSLATATWAMLEGVSMVRVHDVLATQQLRELLVRPLGEVGR